MFRKEGGGRGMVSRVMTRGYEDEVDDDDEVKEMVVEAMEEA